MICQHFLTLYPGHDIRNRSTKQFQAIASLHAVHRWCLTGTPIQNSLEDLGALVAFLKVPILENAPTFRKYISNQLPSKSKDRFTSLRMLLGTICLRRTRELLNLPDPVPQIRRLCLSSTEQAEYEDLILDCKQTIDMAVSGHKKSKNSTMLESLLKLRLFCNNGNSNRYIQTGPTGIPTDPDEALSYLQQKDQAICIYCTGPIYSINNEQGTDGGMWINVCSHLVCRGCLPQHRANKKVCPCISTENSTPSSSQNSGFTTPVTPLSTPTSTPMQLQPFQSNSIQAPPVGKQYPSKLLAFLDDIQKQTRHKRYYSTKSQFFFGY